jgi:chromosomal replication initiation ATPase DnaA
VAEPFIPAEHASAIARAHGVTLHDVLSRSRKLVKVRWQIMWDFRCRGMSLPAIGQAMRRDHSSVVHALKGRPAVREVGDQAV